LAAALVERRQLGLESIFDLPRVDFSQAVLGAKDPVCPDGGVIRRGDYLELVQKLLANVADASVPRIGLAVFETTFEPPRPGMD
jgi:hypothetical protein